MLVLKEYDRNKAVEYAKKWVFNRDPRFKDYDPYGGNCTNYTSQCLLAGNIPMDNIGKDVMGKWYWYSDYNRVPTWTSPSAFRYYALNNNTQYTQNYGLYAVPTTFEDLDRGDLVQLMAQGVAYHTMIVSEILIDKEENVVDYLICQNTSNLLDYPLSLKEGEKSYIKIIGYYS